MNLTWHIVKKDFLRLRLPLALWTGLLLGCIIATEMIFSPRSLEPEWFSRQIGILSVLTFVSVVVCCILTAALALEDPLVGSQLFWVTRPISGGRLLAAKLLGAMLFFIIWPVVVSVPWWLWCGFTLRDVGAGAAQVMALQAVLVLPALALSALAGQSSRFLLWTLALLLALPAGTGMVAYYLPKDLSRDVIASRIDLAYAVGLLTCGTIIWLQYRRRRLAHSILAAAAGAALAVLIGFCWPVALAEYWPKDKSQLPGAENVSLTLSGASRQTKGDLHWVTLMFTANDAPADVSFLSGTVRVDFRWPDGTTLQLQGWVAPINPDYTARFRLGLPPAQPDPATEAKRAEMKEASRLRMLERGLKPEPPLPEGESLITHLGVPAELFDKFAIAPSVRVALRLQTGQAELLAEVPLKEGAAQTGHGARLKILKVEPVPPASPDKPANQVSATVITAQPTRMKFLQFLLVDRAHGTVIMEGASQIPSFRAAVLPVGVNKSPLRLNIPQVWRDGQWVGMPEWLEKDTLAAVTYRPNGGFDRVLQADRLEFVKK